MSVAMPELDEIIDRIEWCPVAMPKFPYPNMDLELDSVRWAWHYTRIDRDGALDAGITARYPLLQPWFDLLPLINIKFARFSSQEGDMAPHVDRIDPSIDYGEPSGYRVVIRGDRSSKFYIVQGEDRVYPQLPDDTDTYIIRYRDTRHGVHADPGRVTIYMEGDLDQAKHRQLLDHSVRRYRDHIVWRR